LGISHSVRKNVKRARMSTNRVPLRVDDFVKVINTHFPPEGSSKFNTEPHDLDFFKFKDYCPEAFLRLRRYWGISERIYLAELCGDRDFIQFISNSKSGQFFYYSNNGRYMIKTLKDGEALQLRRLLPDYYRYMLNNPDSLLVRFVGLHAVKAPSIQRKTHFVIMCSVYSESEAAKCHAVFDLKGSALGRQANQERGEMILKDNDVDRVRRQGKFDKLKMGVKRNGFLCQLELDTGFLAEHNIMDYSLLLGLHNSNRFKKASYLDIRSGRFVAFNPEDPRQRFGSNAGSAVGGGGDEHSNISSVYNQGRKKLSMSIIPPAFWDQEASANEGPEQKNLNISTYAVFEARNYYELGFEEDERYYMGIIDILQKYNWKKRLETLFKTLQNRRNRHIMSSVPPEEYKTRFLKFIGSLTDGEKQQKTGNKEKPRKFSTNNNNKPSKLRGKYNKTGLEARANNKKVPREHLIRRQKKNIIF